MWVELKNFVFFKFCSVKITLANLIFFMIATNVTKIKVKTKIEKENQDAWSMFVTNPGIKHVSEQRKIKHLNM